MTVETPKKPLCGVVPPMVTPLLDEQTLDVPGLHRLVEHLVEGGVHGLFILGTTGEAPSLEYRLKEELIRRTCELVDRRLPVLVGISETSLAESVRVADRAAECGAHALVMAPPYYFPAGQAELLDYLEQLLAHLKLPLFLYNMPYASKPVFAPETVRHAAALGGIAGLKDSSSDMVYFHQLQMAMADRSEFSLLTGNECLLAESVLMGAHGGVCGGALVFPRLYVALYEAASRGDLPAVRELHRLVMQVGTAIYGVGQYASSGIKGIKCALSCMGVCSDFMPAPFRRFAPPQRELLQERLVKLGELHPTMAFKAAGPPQP